MEKKNPTYKQLFEMLAKKFEEDSKKLLFQFVLREVIAYIEKFNQPPNWQNFDIDGGAAINLYGVFICVLHNKAVELESIEDDPVWQDANEILEIIRATLEETHDDGDLTLNKKTLLPPHEEMVQAGLIEIVEGDDGQRYVKPTPLCEQVADEVQTKIDHTERSKHALDN
jgi:hypothetical protein